MEIGDGDCDGVGARIRGVLGAAVVDIATYFVVDDDKTDVVSAGNISASSPTP